MTRIVLLSQDADLTELKAAFAARGGCAVQLAGEPGAELAEIAVCWNPPPGSLGTLPRLRLVHSMAAGVDHLASDPSRPDVAVCRVVDPDLRQGMAEYVIWGVLHHFRRFDEVLQRQPRGEWHSPEQRPARDWRIGVLGLGALGAYVAQSLSRLGFEVRGWSRTAKAIPGVATWSGRGQLEPFSRGLDCAVCLLPLTDDSRGILDAALFARMRRGAVLINSGRGGHLVREGLVEALRTGQLRAALLDAFDHEPLPPEDPLWTTPGVTVTPHMASAASNEAIVDQVLANAGRLRNGEPLLNRIDPRLGY